MLRKAKRDALPRTPESQMYGSVMEVLRLAGCFVWRQNNQPGVRIVERLGGALVKAWLTPVEHKGIADIGGIAPGGRAIQVECKRPDGELSGEQSAWLSTVATTNGIAMLVTSTDEVVQLVKDVQRLMEKQGLTRYEAWNMIASPWQIGQNAQGGLSTSSTTRM